jgi:hypothetical protein
MNTLHPLFADILRGIEQQPLMLHRAAVKAEVRRFTGEPPSAFADLGGIGVRGSDRWLEVMEEERQCMRDDEYMERREYIERGGDLE